MTGWPSLSTTLFVEAFGRLVPIPERVAPDPESPQEVHEYLWSVFLDRSEHMRWSNMEGSGAARLWEVEEAELTYQLGGSRIGFAQVGLDVNPATIAPAMTLMVDEEPPPDIDLLRGSWSPVPVLDDAGPPTDPVVAISPLIQCLDDSLRWFGETEISAYQVSGVNLQPRSLEQFRLGSVLGWFSVVVPTAVTPAVITMTSTQGSDRLVADVFAGIKQGGVSFFEIGPLLSASEANAAGVAVSMPEWSPAAFPPDLSVRVTRSTPE